MSTDSGDASVAASFLADAKSMVDARAVELEQLNLLDPVGPEDIAAARAELGGAPGRLTVLAHARERKRGRPTGSRNRRTDDFARYLLSFGQHPAITMMQIQATPTEVLQELSGKPYLDCLDRRIRCAEGLMPYLESKKPVSVDLSFAGASDLIIEDVTHTRAEIDEIVDGEFADVAQGEDRL